MTAVVTEEVISAVSCAGCRRVVGVTASISPVPRIFCSEVCHKDYPVSDNESRDGLIAYLLHKKMPKGKIAEAFGLSRQRIIQMANAMRSEGTLTPRDHE